MIVWIVIYKLTYIKRAGFKTPKYSVVNQLKHVWIFLEDFRWFLLGTQNFALGVNYLVLKLKPWYCSFLISLFHLCQALYLVFFVPFYIKSLDNCTRQLTQSDIRVKVTIQSEIQCPKDDNKFTWVRKICRTERDQ